MTIYFFAALPLLLGCCNFEIEWNTLAIAVGRRLKKELRFVLTVTPPRSA